jgi:hypothetical protein
VYSENTRSTSGYIKMSAHVQLHTDKISLNIFVSPLRICNVSRLLANVSSTDVVSYCRPLSRTLADDAGSSVKQNGMLRDVGNELKDDSDGYIRPFVGKNVECRRV